MSELSVEKKLQLVQQVRTQYNRNQFDLRTREQILYGRTGTAARLPESDVPVYAREPDEISDFPKSTFRLRLLAALILAAAVIVFDNNGHSLLGVDTSKIFSVISEDFEAEAMQLPEGVLEALGADGPDGPEAGGQGAF